MCSTHSCGQAGWGPALTCASSGGQMGLARHCQAVFCQVTHPRCCGGGGEASPRRMRGGLRRCLLQEGRASLRRHLQGCCAVSAQQPVTLDLPYLSLSKAGTRALFHCCKGHPHPLWAQHFPRSWRGMYTPGSLTLNQFETGRTAFSQPGNRGPGLHDRDGGFSSQGGGSGPSSRA